MLYSQSVKVITYSVSSRTVDADTNDIFTMKYNGLSNVEVGTTVYSSGIGVDTNLAVVT